ncbi:SMI1/KNR4 family protein [Nocardia sp. NBC_00881]|uniref:SMI1/KNR4 family protein n=1 Tax=Nocardia sp. NBC_00881 TaxID=2975995 RepID=UPI003868AE8C|nr:SMI1/KNR4 family protein [Nocardia sp. NBC_00881]
MTICGTDDDRTEDRTLTSQHSWPVLLGLAIKAKYELLRLDSEQQWETLPRVKNTDAAIQQFEYERRLTIPSDYRDFLLHADGWEGCFFDLGLFGLSELRGAENGMPALELLRRYTNNGTLRDSGIVADEVLPIVAGPVEHLVLMVHSGARAGRVIWFDGGAERTAYPDFADFFEDLLGIMQDRVEQLTPGERPR